MIETVVGAPLPQLVADLPYPAPAWRGEYERRWPGELRFGAEHLAFHFSDAMLDMPCITADAKDFDAAYRECERLQAQALAELDANGNAPRMLPQVREWLHVCTDTYPTLEDAAEHFQISARTLMRRLKAEGSGYQAVLDDVRKERAVWFLQQTRMTVDEIAAKLGYIDTSNFSRTFRRWFGMTPVEMRAAPRNGEPATR